MFNLVINKYFVIFIHYILPDNIKGLNKKKKWFLYLWNLTCNINNFANFRGLRIVKMGLLSRIRNPFFYKSKIIRLKMPNLIPIKRTNKSF